MVPGMPATTPGRRKHPGAVALGKRRWQGTTAAERRAATQKAIRARWDRYRAARAAPIEDKEP
jgi:hypothetical protein